MDATAGRSQWRSFGLIVGSVFAVIGAWPAVKNGLPPRLWALAAAGVLIVPALAYPPILKYPYAAWMALGRALGWINTRIILSILFYGVFTPIGAIRRALGKDSMQRSFDADAETYRQVRDPRPGSHMKRQF